MDHPIPILPKKRGEILFLFLSLSFSLGLLVDPSFSDEELQDVTIM